MNKVYLLGNLGSDVEIKYTSNQKAVATLRLATNKTWKDDKGVKHEEVQWHRVVCWGTTAENCAKYLSKGRQVLVEGELKTRSWDDKETKQKRYTTEVVAEKVTFIGQGKSKDEDAGASDAPAPDASESEVPL